MGDQLFRGILSEIASLLENDRNHTAVGMVHEALDGDDQKLEGFLKSNELWGGSGSIADQSLIADPARRKRLETLLIRLGRFQLEVDRVNVRTRGWVETFEKWQSLKTG
jgi:hypothetical protein